MENGCSRPPHSLGQQNSNGPNLQHLGCRSKPHVHQPEYRRVHYPHPQCTERPHLPNQESSGLKLHRCKISSVETGNETDIPPFNAGGESAPETEEQLDEQCLRYTVAKERKRRKRITASCEQLRELLPSFKERKNDMASILEMTVMHLELVRQLSTPSLENSTGPDPPVVKQISEVCSKANCCAYRSRTCKKCSSAENAKEPMNMTRRTVQAPENVTPSTNEEWISPLNLSMPKATVCSILFCDAHDHFSVLATPPQQSHPLLMQSRSTGRGSLKTSNAATTMECPGTYGATTPMISARLQPDNLDAVPFLFYPSPMDWPEEQEEMSSPLSLSIAKATACSIPFCEAHDQLSVLATPPQLSPLLSSTSRPLLTQSRSTLRGSMKPSNAETIIECPGSDGVTPPTISNRLHPEVIDSMPFLIFPSTAHLLEEQEKMHYLPLQDDDQLFSDCLCEYPAESLERAAKINDYTFIPVVPDQPHPQAFKEPSEELLESYQPSCLLQLPYKEDLEMSLTHFSACGI